MCGRYSLTIRKKALLARFECEDDGGPETGPRYNIAPTQRVPMVVGPRGARRLELMRWGLLPPWAETADAAGFINARSETLTQKDSFKSLLDRQRAIVPADGFYEWRKGPDGRQPIRFQLRAREPFAFAGLWDTWTRPGHEPVTSFTILTTRPNELTAPVHDRMPVILRPVDEAAWLDPEHPFSALPSGLFEPFPASAMLSCAVSPAVNSVRHDGPECIQPAVEQGMLF